MSGKCYHEKSLYRRNVQTLRILISLRLTLQRIARNIKESLAGKGNHNNASVKTNKKCEKKSLKERMPMKLIRK